MKKAPARFVEVKSMVVKGPFGFWPMRPRPKQSNPTETATAHPKAHLKGSIREISGVSKTMARWGGGLGTGSYSDEAARRRATDG